MTMHMRLETDQHDFFEAVIFRSTGHELAIEDMQFVSGGCINNAVRAATKAGAFFIKWHEVQPDASGEYPAVFEAEAKGLALLAAHAGQLFVPEVYGQGIWNGRAYICMQFIDSARPISHYWEMLGHGLAAIHRQSAPHFGLDHDNFIGSLPQSNNPTSSWATFFVEQRLRPQFGRAYYQGLIGASYLRDIDRLAVRLADFFPVEPPALLHGDLWSGNVMPGPQGQPALYDPAVYYGHREMELAFTHLFGGFDDQFYHAYQESFPLTPGFAERRPVYNLYPLMVHLNMFGTGYLSGVDLTLRRLL